VSRQEQPHQLPEMPGLIALSPAGHPYLGELPDDAVFRRIGKAFEAGHAAGLFHLGAAEVATPLPSDLGWWRDFARRFVAALCAVADLETLRERVEVPFPRAELEPLLSDAPPMLGAEYLTLDVLEMLWRGLHAQLRGELSQGTGTVQELLTRKHSGWNVVGRVHFHLAENKRDPERPFAFLASYTTGLSAQGKPQHRPLGEAVRESSSAKDKDRLLALLRPLLRASERSAYVKELVDSGAAYQPQAWTPAEAYRLLREIPACEESGLVVRLPDWWKARPRPQVSVAIGGREPSNLGLDALLDFSAELSIGGERVTAAELEALRAQSEGLVLFKGRWVEVDKARLDEVLAHWKKVQRHAQDGVSFIEGMRLLSGAQIEASTYVDAGHEWLGVTAGAWLSKTLEGLRALRGADVPGLKAELRPYQRVGVEWLLFLSRLGLGACLADDMGLGKTVQVLALLLKIRDALPGPHLLVVPASLLANWKAEAERFAPELKLKVVHPSVPDAEGAADVVLTSYGVLQRTASLQERAWGLVVLDEAQAIKNPAARQTKAVKALKPKGRIALTGTPVENRVGDLWSLFDFVNPGLLGSAKQFGAFVKQPNAYRALRELTRPYILRRLKTDKSVIADLPEKTEVEAFCALTKQQAALYQDSVASLKRELSNVDGIRRRGLVLAYLMRFKQICNHPSQWLGDGRYDAEASGKLERLREICEVVASRQEKVLVFTQFKEMTRPLSQWLTGLFGRPGLVLSGDTPVKQRQQLVKTFQEDEQVPFFVLSLKAGGTGLNLTAASHVIHFDRWWNPAVENQATDRAFRIGQKKNVLVHKLVCRGTVEERVAELIASKQGLARELLEEGSELKLTELDDKALLNLVSLDLRSAAQE
jgi:superfamily II DNA or RNA helicase